MIGLRDNVRTYLDLAEQAAWTKRVLVEARPALQITSWFVHSGATYVAPCEFMHSGLRLDVVGVTTLLATPELARADSLAACIATTGTYFYDPDEPTQSARWDDGVSRWDDGILKWDQFLKLYVHLADESDPNLTVVMAEFGLFYANSSVVHPDLGPDLLANGNLETWASATDASSWTETISNAQVNRVVGLRANSTFAAELKRTAPSGSAVLGQTTAITLVAGASYRLSGYYKTPSDQPEGGIRIKKADGTASLLDDGRNVAANGTTVIPLAATHGEVRRFTFDFVAPWSGAIPELVSDADSIGSITFDDVSLRRIFRWNRYRARVSSASIPTVGAASNDIFFGGKQTGIGSVSLINEDGLFDKALASLDWVNREVLLKVGGAFLAGEDGVVEELPIEDYRTSMVGLVQKPRIAEDREVQFDLEDLRTTFFLNLPLRNYPDGLTGNYDPTAIGKPRPLFFGVKKNIRPVRIDKTSNGYPVLEIADTQKAPSGIKAVDTVFAYLNTEAAQKKDTSKRRILVAATDYSSDLTQGRITILLDVTIREIIAGENDRLDFSDGTVRAAVLTPDVYTTPGLASHVQTQMNAVSSGITVSYSDTTHKVTISKASGTLTLLLGTGTNKERGVFKTLGFTGSADLSGSLSYTADAAIFADADKNHIIRVDAKGFKDDASGTWTGSANALIEIGAHIFKLLWVRYLRRPLASLDTTSFNNAASRAPESLTLYLNETKNFKDIVETLEFSNIANILISSDGQVFYEVYVGEVPANVVTLKDADFLAFSTEWGAQDVYRNVKVFYDRDPTLNEFRYVTADAPNVEGRFQRPEQREFTTYLKIEDNAQAAASRLRELAKAPARKVTAQVKGRLLDHRIGQKIRITRARAGDKDGALSNAVFRIISIRHNHALGLSEFEAVDDVITVAGVVCVATCQAFCESTCQTGCEQECQASCELSCQVGCETGCQDCSQVTCQETCQTTCQAGCEVACQTTCQTTCQAGCQASCQAGCQSGCETACEASCQHTCETACQQCGQAGMCQTSCQSACQDTCELSCQTGCEVACQTTCETACQDTCQINCQDSCQIACQTSCQTSCQQGLEGPPQI